MSKLRYNHAGFTLVSHLFRQFLVEENIDTEAAERVTISQFYKWVKGRRDVHAEYEYGLFPDKDELQEAYDIEDEHFEFVDNLLSKPFLACSHLYVWWPLLCMAGRKPLKNKPVAISLAISIQFSDGLTAHFPMPLGLQSEPYSDGMVLTLWRAQMSQIANMLRDSGLDEIHDLVEASGGKLATLEVTSEDEGNSDLGFG
jgi:hypothetical protein